jgi:CheY-like chemotaxis protein
MQILLVDDDCINHKIASQILNRWGLSVTLATSGEQAIEMLENKCYDLVLMDIHMPGMDGTETTDKIRSQGDAYYKTVPILACTASNLADSKEKAEKLGMNDYVGKPLIPEELHCKINQYIYALLLDPRPLKIKFDLYADSDPEFKLELITLMISNLRELQYASYRSFYKEDAGIFNTIAHRLNQPCSSLTISSWTILSMRLRIYYSFAVPQQ